MSRPVQLFAASLLTLASVHPVAADPSIDPGVVDVRTAGFWEDGGLGGTYRVVVRHFGFEEISTAITFEWVSDDTRESLAHLVHSVVFAGSLLGSVGIDSMRATAGGVKVVLVGTLHNGSSYRCVVELRPGGNFGKGQGC